MDILWAVLRGWYFGTIIGWTLAKICRDYFYKRETKQLQHQIDNFNKYKDVFERIQRIQDDIERGRYG